MRLPATVACCLVSALAVAAGDLDVARQALNDGMWETALSSADIAATNAAERTSARLVSLEALARLGRNAEIERRLFRWSDETDEHFRFWRARAHVCAGEFNLALEALDEPFADKGLSLPARFLKACALAAIGKRAEALGLISPGDLDGRQGPVSEDAGLLMGELLHDAGRNAEACGLLSPLADHAERKEVRLRAGYLLGFAEMADESSRTAGVARVRGLLRSAPGEKVSVQAARTFADSLLAYGDAAGADDEYRRYLEIAPVAATDPDILSRRGRALFLLGRHSEAIGFFARAEQLSTDPPKKALAAFCQAEAFLADRHYPEAAESFARSAGYGGDGVERARFAEADALERAGDSGTAESIYGELERKGGEWGAKASLRLAAIDVRRGRIGVAVDRYDGLIASNRLAGADMTEAYLGRGRACYKGYRFAEAAESFKVVAKREPRLSDGMRFLEALCLYGAGMDVDAKAVATSLMSSTKDMDFRTDLMLWCAKYEYNHGKYEDARTYFETYANLRPASPDAASALLWAARSSAAMMDYSKAVDFATRAANTASTNREFFVEVLLVQGEALMELGRYAEAAQLFGRAATQLPDGPGAIKAAVLKADALYAMGAGDSSCYDEAISAYRALPDGSGLTPDRRIEVAFKIGRALEKLRRTRLAMDQYYKNVVLAYSEGTEKGILFGEAARAFFVRAAFSLADYSDSAGNYKAAISVLERVVSADVPASREAKRRIAAIRKKGGA